MVLILHPLYSNDSVAQQVEHMPFKHRVLGSSPSGITSQKTAFCKAVFSFQLRPGDKAYNELRLIA